MAETITIPVDIGVVLVRIIDASSKRGTFNGEELSVVGAARAELVEKINAANPDAKGLSDTKNEISDSNIESEVA